MFDLFCFCVPPGIEIFIALVLAGCFGMVSGMVPEFTQLLLENVVTFKPSSISDAHDETPNSK